MEWLRDRSYDNYLLAAVIVLAALAIFDTPFQSIFKMAVWTVIVLGVLMQIAWPMLNDRLSRAVFALICIVHLLIVHFTYPLMPQDGYVPIGIAVVAEIFIFSIPLGWLLIRHRRASNIPSENSGSHKL